MRPPVLTGGRYSSQRFALGFATSDKVSRMFAFPTLRLLRPERRRSEPRTPPEADVGATSTPPAPSAAPHPPPGQRDFGLPSPQASEYPAVRGSLVQYQ